MNTAESSTTNHVAVALSTCGAVDIVEWRLPVHSAQTKDAVRLDRSGIFSDSRDSAAAQLVGTVVPKTLFSSRAPHPHPNR